MPEKPEKALSREERNICELTWGGIPVDVGFVRKSLIFQQMKVEYEKHRYLFEGDRKGLFRCECGWEGRQSEMKMMIITGGKRPDERVSKICPSCGSKDLKTI